MQVAFIPPAGLLERMWQSPVQMALAPQVLKVKGYAESCRLMGQQRNNYLILDNGACEGEMVDPLRLTSVAGQVKASEIVLPDHMGHKNDSIELVKMFLNHHRQSGYKYMAVVHGKNITEAKLCIDEYAMEPAIKTIGLPRILATTCESKVIRLDLAMWISEFYPGRFNVHFLGMQSAFVKEIKFAGKYYSDTVRSVDSSAPYNFAIAKRALDADCEQNVPRHKQYFTSSWAEKIDQVLMKHNEEVLKTWASGTN